MRSVNSIYVTTSDNILNMSDIASSVNNPGFIHTLQKSLWWNAAGWKATQLATSASNSRDGKLILFIMTKGDVKVRKKPQKL